MLNMGVKGMRINTPEKRENMTADSPLTWEHLGCHSKTIETCKHRRIHQGWVRFEILTHPTLF